jgi:hypothetical protein
MRNLRGAAVAIGFAGLLAGCAAPEIPYDRTAAGEVKSIGIVTPSFPEEGSVILATSVGKNFGLVGALIDAGMQANRDSQFKDMLQRQGFSIQDSFVASLSEGLKRKGYDVSVIPFTREAKKDFAAHYPVAAGGKVDAYLDLVAMDYGYIAAGIGSSTPYRPHLVMKARLVSVKDSSVLMQDLILYNPVAPASKAITVAPDPAYTFADFDALVGNPGNAVQGLKTAADKSAETISQLLQ